MTSGKIKEERDLFRNSQTFMTNLRRTVCGHKKRITILEKRIIYLQKKSEQAKIILFCMIMTN